MRIAQEHARAALLLDDGDAWSFLADGLVKCLDREFSQSISAFRAAISLNPNFSVAHGYMALPLSMCGETEAAIAGVQQAIRISPRDPYNVAYLHFAAISHFANKQYREALEFDRRALQERPNFVIALRFIAACHVMMGEMDEARVAVRELLRLQPNCTIDYVNRLPRYGNPNDQDRFINALLKAGVPER